MEQCTNMVTLIPYILPLSNAIHRSLKKPQTDLLIGKNCVYHRIDGDSLLWRYNLGRTSHQCPSPLVLEHRRMNRDDHYCLRRVSHIEAMSGTGEIVTHRELVLPESLRSRMRGLYLQYRCYQRIPGLAPVAE